MPSPRTGQEKGAANHINLPPSSRVPRNGERFKISHFLAIFLLILQPSQAGGEGDPCHPQRHCLTPCNGGDVFLLLGGRSTVPAKSSPGAAYSKSSLFPSTSFSIPAHSPVPTGQVDLSIPTFTFETKSFLFFPPHPSPFPLLPRCHLFSPKYNFPPASNALMSAFNREKMMLHLKEMLFKGCHKNS